MNHLSVAPVPIAKTLGEWAGMCKIDSEGKARKDKISEHLPENQEFAISYGVPSKILAHPNDAFEKVFGSEYSERVRGLGGNVCPSKAFEMSRNRHVHLDSSSSISPQRIEDLEK
ncbi:40S ribosomal protein S12 [Capsicum baccatum]|uniref:40S ribosomal protein S12 n=1 Tax=Capsicum baccatum TaxID=33114 RepID=A0A2G2VG43_CAPBA|nr:40S ribosomal protein S12 [Capsicum baccatum]